MNLRKTLGPLAPFCGFFVLTLCFLTLSRSVLAGMNWERITAFEILMQVMLSGLRMDTILLSMVLVIPVVLTLAVPDSISTSRFFRLPVRWLLCAWFVLFAFLELSTPVYIDFFDSRPGRIFFEYLNHPREVGTLLLNGFLMQSVFVSAATVLSVIIVNRLLVHWQARQVAWRYPVQILMLPVVVTILVLGGRSTLGHRAVNASSVAFSNDQLLNELGLSSAYTLLSAIYALQNEGDQSRLYPWMSDAEVFDRVRRMSLVGDRFSDPALPTMHHFGTQSQLPKRNLVIVLEESMGARFIGKLGGLPLSPRIDGLSGKGLWFTQLFATGIRSARGIEAVVTGFPPSASRSVLKLGLAQQDFYTMARTLKAQGYKNYFIYGGESHFDNMRGFLLNNGFDHAVDEKDYDQWKFKGSWGVSDEDVFDKANTIFKSEQGPFFALIFSSSFHSPFEFPDDRIELYDEKKNTRNNAVKYADHAVGYYFDLAQKEAYWKDTVFLVVADHDERPRGSSLVPVSSYHIPGLILGAGVEPRIYDRVTSHIDLMPTLFGLLGIAGEAPFIGHDVLRRADDHPGRALMQFGENHAYMRGDEVVIHTPHKPPSQYRYVDGSLVPMNPSNELVRDALAMALLPGLLYRNQYYRPSVSSLLPARNDRDK